MAVVRALLFLVLLPGAGIAQSLPDYRVLVSLGDSLYEQKLYAQAAIAYSEGFRANGWKGEPGEHFNAACSWAQAGKPDSAFLHLDKVAYLITDLKGLTADPDLIPLHTDKRWSSLVEYVKRNKEKADVNLIKPLAKELDSIYSEDQRYRQKLDSMEKLHGRESKQVKDLWMTILKHDTANLKRVTQLLDQYGWLGPDKVGRLGNTTLFLVIQHADLRTQEKYLPMMREATKDGRAQAANLALLEDRVALGQGKKQIYGSQINFDQATGKYVVAPIEDEANVNNRRAQMGLGPLEQYVRRWGIVYTVPKK